MAKDKFLQGMAAARKNKQQPNNQDERISHLESQMDKVLTCLEKLTGSSHPVQTQPPMDPMMAGLVLLSDKQAAREDKLFNAGISFQQQQQFIGLYKEAIASGAKAFENIGSLFRS